MVAVIVVLLIVLLLICRVASAVELGDYARLAEVDVLRRLSAIDIVSAVGVQSPHLVEVQGFGGLSVFIGTLSVLPVDVGGGVVRVHARDEPVLLVLMLSSLLKN